MTLLEGKIMGRYQVVEVNTKESMTRRLQALGINEKTCLKIVNKKRNGSIIIMVRGSRLAIGKEISTGITVCPVKDGEPHEEKH